MSDPVIKMASAINDFKVLPTNTFLDEALGIGGIPLGRIGELWGENNVGKSTLCIQIIKAAQEAGLTCCYVDVEETFTAKWAQDLGVDISKLGVFNADSAEEYIDGTEALLKSGKWDVVIFDSIGSLSSKVEQEKTAEQKTIGIQASLMARFVRLIAPVVRQKHIAFIGVNHQRIDMDKRIYQMGGKAWSEKKKWAVRLREKSGAVLKSGDKIVGKVIIARVSKNHVGPTEGWEKDVRIINGQGFSYAQNLLQDAIDRGVISKDGNSHFFEGEKIGMIGKAREWIKEPDNAERIKKALSV